MKPEILHRLVQPIQRRGNVGKSLVISALAQYCTQRDVVWQGYDLDPDHQSLHRLFPDSVSLIELGNEPEGEILKIARACAAAPVTLVDPRAHISDVVLRAWSIIDFPAAFAAASGRITVVVFPADDLEILTDIDATATTLGDKVDWLVVRNPARQPRTRMFDGSALETDLRQLGAVTLQMPVMLAMARNHLAALEAELGRGIPPVEAAADQSLGLDPMARLVVDDWVRTLFRRFDAIADILLPSKLADRIKSFDGASTDVAQPRIRRGAKINRSDL